MRRPWQAGTRSVVGRLDWTGVVIEFGWLQRSHVVICIPRDALSGAGWWRADGIQGQRGLKADCWEPPWSTGRIADWGQHNTNSLPQPKSASLALVLTSPSRAADEFFTGILLQLLGYQFHSLFFHAHFHGGLSRRQK